MNKNSSEAAEVTTPLAEVEGSQELKPCPLTVSQNREGTWDILINGSLPVPRLTQWTQGGAEETIRVIHEAYTRSLDASGYVRGLEEIATYCETQRTDFLERERKALAADKEHAAYWDGKETAAAEIAAHARALISQHQETKK